MYRKMARAMFGMVLCAFLGATVRADIVNGLVGYWPLDGNAEDASGNDFHGTISNVTPAADRLGTANAAMSFTGAPDSIIRVGDLPKLQLTGEMTLAAWVVLNSTNANNSRAITKMGGSNARSWSLNIERTSGGITFPGTFQVASSGSTLVSLVDTQPLPTDEWVHMAGVYRPAEAMELYVNGELHRINATGIPATQYSANSTPVMIGNLTAYNNCGWTGLIDEARIYARALSASDILELVSGRRGLATGPVPASEATDVPADTRLSWTAGEFAATHNVYLGTSFQDVNDASVAQALGVLARAGQDTTTFDPGPLEFGRTYYWRIDEVNDAPDNTVYNGNVWSFTVEAYSYPVKPIQATASSAQPEMGPEKTIDGSGLAGDLHGVEPSTMWMSTGIGPNWIQYEFDQVYKLHQLLVWNSNQQVEPFVGFGARKVAIETSIDGAAWTPVADVPEFSRAPGAASYVANTSVSLGGTEARYVRLTINTNWSGMTPPTGLAEVRFFYVPLRARLPQPANAATGVGVDATMDWRPGREATSHTVYFGADADAVANGTVAAITVTDHGYVPQALNLGTTYYWRVDEVGAVTYPGKVWHFTTQEYRVVDDFESYTDKAGQEVFAAWADGFDNPAANGAIVGLATSVNGTFCDTTIFHGGRQAAPFAYDNTQAPLSEAVLTFETPQDWTANGIKSLSLWFQGTAGNSGQLYVKINGTKVLYGGDAADLARTIWNVWNVDLSQAGQVKSVRSLTIGVEGAGAKGTLYIDDVHLYPRTPESVIPVAPDAAGLQAQFQFEGNANDSSGKGRHGTVQGGATYAAGKVGQALRLDGTDDSVSLSGYQGILADAAGVQRAFTACAWIKTAANGEIIAWGTNVGGQRLNFRVDTVLRVEHGNGNVRGTGGPSLLDDEWHHVAVTVPQAGRMMDARLYVDGRDVTPASTTTAAFNLKAGVDVVIGMGGATGGRFFKGLIDEVRLYDRVLSVGEIASLAGLTRSYDVPF